MKPRAALTILITGFVTITVATRTIAQPPAPVDDRTEAAGVPPWGLGPFVRLPENPVLKPRADSVFFCPIEKQTVPWESKNVVGTAAVVKDGKVHLLYRAEPNNCHHSRIGLGISDDGIRFQRLPEPVLYPANDEFQRYEWPGGTEDGRIVQRDDGLYVCLYPAYDGQTARQCAATSRDLRQWTKHGPVFAKALGGKYRDAWTKSGSVVSRYLDDGRVLAAKINGKYWMYVGDRTFFAAFSDDCLQWTPVETADGTLRNVLPPRPGKFDCTLTEPGPPPVVTPKGILVLYTGKNDRRGGDPRLPHKAYSGGQALFDLADPTKLLERCDDFFITPRMPYELDNAIGCPVTFLESMVRFRGKWFLYYGSGDKVVSAATCDKPAFADPP